MAKSSVTPAVGPRLCPTCGTRVGAVATKCLVCGADLTVAGGRGSTVAARGRSLSAPQVTLSMPVLVGLVVILLVMGGGLLVMASGGGFPFGMGQEDAGTPTPTASVTPPPTFTSPPTPTETPVPSPTPLPPLAYTVVAGDTCGVLAFTYNVSVASIIELNNLNPNCILTVGSILQIPQPTYTPTPLPTATLNQNVEPQPTPVTHIVQAGETLAGIAKFFGLSVVDLMEANGITDPDSIQAGQILIIPIEKIVTPGPSPTPTLPPPYLAPNLLQPAEGMSFQPEAVITLQWASVGELRSGEFYYVTVEDVTCQCAAIRQFPVTETKLILPAEMQPTDGRSHLFRWIVTTVRQRNLGDGGAPVYDPAGATSLERHFIWPGMP